MRIAVAQFAPTANVEANLENVRLYVDAAAARGAQLVVFPEYSAFFTGRLNEEMTASAESVEGVFVSGLRLAAAQANVVVVAGFLEAADDAAGLPSNAVVAISQEGELLCAYDKIHLYDAFTAKESDVLAPGKVGQRAVFESNGFKFGIQTCYDLRFPEITRTHVDAGAEVIVIPAQWVPGPQKVEHWETLLRARAIENTVYVIGADQASPSGVGHSMAFGPDGQCLVRAGDEAELLLLDLDAESIRSVRTINPSLRLRRFHVVAGAPVQRDEGGR